MEITTFNGSNKRWRKRGYNRLKVVRLNRSRRSWRLRPLKLWYRLKNTYVKMMLKFANVTGSSNAFGNKRIPKPPMPYSRTEFENRLVLEIYKSMVASLELGYNK